MPKLSHMIKDPTCRDRIRCIRAGFGWMDHRLVRDRYIAQCSPPALALYLFPVTVSNADGANFWGDKAFGARLRPGMVEIAEARDGLLGAGLIAYEKPLWQVLQLRQVARRQS